MNFAPARVKPLLDLALAVGRAEIGALHGVAVVRHARSLPQMQMIGRQRRAQRAAGIAGRRLDPDVVENAVAQHLAVGDAVERDAAGEAQILRCRSRLRSERASRSTTSSVTAWIEAARSMWRCVSGSSGLRGGPPNSASKRALVIVRPVQ